MRKGACACCRACAAATRPPTAVPPRRDALRAAPLAAV